MTQTNTTLNSSVRTSDANTLQYVFDQILFDINTMLPCEIINVNGDRYDVQSLINNLDSVGNPITPPILYNLPAMVEMGGYAGFITEYKKGDKVAVGFCQRDLSVVQKDWSRQNPPSYRKHSLSDGIIIKRVSNTPPTIYIKVTDSGITIEGNNTPINVHTTGNASITANEVDINSNNINLGSGGVGILNANTIITAPSGGGVCSISMASTTVKATS